MFTANSATTDPACNFSRKALFLRALWVLIPLLGTSLCSPSPVQANDARCINALVKNARTLSKAQATHLRSCVTNADRKSTITAETCFQSDPRGSIAKLRQSCSLRTWGGVPTDVAAWRLRNSTPTEPT